MDVKGKRGRTAVVDRFGLTAIDGGGKSVDTCKRIPRVFLPLAGGSQLQGYFTVSHDREGFHLLICLVAFACFVDKCIHVGWRESRKFIMNCRMANGNLGWGGELGRGFPWSWWRSFGGRCGRWRRFGRFGSGLGRYEDFAGVNKIVNVSNLEVATKFLVGLLVIA